MQPLSTYKAANDYESEVLADYALGPIKWGAAVVGDLGTTIYNSIVPEQYETSTYNVLSSINSDVASFYSDNTDAVEFGSFVGGLVIPGLGVARAAKMAGNIGGGVFGGIGRISSLGYSAKKIETYANRAAELAKTGNATTAAMKEAIWKQRLWTAENAFAENVLFEASFYAMMNDHAYMDDYGLDTFALSTAIGTAFTTPIQMAIRNKDIKDLASTFQLSLHNKYGKGELYAVNPRAVASQYDTGTALAGLQFTVTDLTNQVNKVVDPADAEMRSLIKSNQMQQEVHLQEATFSLLDPKTQKLSSEYSQPKDIPTQGWNEMRADPYAVSTPMQILGSYNKEFPNALIGAERGTAAMATPKLSNIGYREVMKSGKMVDQAIADDGWLTATMRTYDEAIDFLGGKKFKINENLAHVYEWDGRVYQSDAVHGRLLRRAADDGLSINKKYNIEAPHDYIPSASTLPELDIGFLDAMRSIGAVQAVRRTADETDLHTLQALAHAEYGAKVRIGGKAVDLTPDQLVQQLREAKMQHIETMNFDGYDIHQISIATNTPIETIEVAMQTGWNRAAMDKVKQGDDLRWSVYDNISEEALNKYLTPTTMTLGVTPRTSNPWHGAIQQDRDLLANVTRAASDAIVAKSKSPLLRSVFEATAGKATNKTLAQSLWQLYATGASGSRWTSTDMYLRAWENLGPTITTMGTDFQTLINEKGIAPMRKIMQPLAEAVASDGRAAIVNFEHVRNALDAIPAGKTAAQMFYDEAERKIVLSTAKNGTREYLPIPGTNQDWVAEFDSVHHFINDGVMRMGKGTWEMRRTNSELTNTTLATQRGIHIPYDNISEDFVSYLIDPKDPTNIKRISGNNLAQLNTKVAKIKQEIAGTGLEIIPRAELDRTWNKYNDYASLEYLQEANPENLKSGIASRDVTGNVDVLDRVLKSYEGEITKQARIFLRGSNSEVFDTLAQLANHHDDLARSARGTDAQKMQSSLNPARLASKTLLNMSKLGDNPLMDGANNATDLIIDWTRGLFAKGGKILKDKLRDGVKLNEEDFIAFSKEMGAKNIPNPFKDVHEFVQAAMPQDKQQAKHTVAAGAQIMTLFNLRLAEASHAIVTTLSAPALIMGEASSLGASPMKHMMAVAKYAFSNDKPAHMQAVVDRMRDMGYGARKTSEATSLLSKAVGSKGFLQHLSEVDTQTLKELYGVVGDAKGGKAKTKAAADLAYKGLTKPSDWAEEMTREFAYLTGYEISKSRHPLSSAAVHEEAANLFTVRSMGNYTSRQRPTMFQGSFGQAMGLYQTFMFTVGQNLTRMIETKNVKALGVFGGSYTATFGLEGLPFYSDMNEMIGKYVDSPEGQDITQTVYEVFGNKYSGHERSVGEYLLYGAPSALFQSAWYTRGDLDPRVPIEAGRIAPPVLTAIADIAANTWATGKNIAQLSSVGAPMTDIGKAFGEGIMMQHMWRPAARLAELGLGYSVDRKGEIIAQEEEVRNKWHPIFARISGARPLKEAVLRQQRYYNKLYDTTDTHRRRLAVRSLRTHLRGGSADGGVVSGLMQNYLRDGGSAEGWGTVLQKTYLSSSQPLSDKLLDEVRNQGGIADIIEGYGF